MIQNGLSPAFSSLSRPAFRTLEVDKGPDLNGFDSSSCFLPLISNLYFVYLLVSLARSYTRFCVLITPVRRTLITFSLPISKSLYFLYASEAGGVRFGIWGWCLEQDPVCMTPIKCESLFFGHFITTIESRLAYPPDWGIHGSLK